MPDEVIAGRYRLVERVGSGAMGVVWRAHDERLGRTVAVKQVTPAGGADEAARAESGRRVLREGRLSARLHHPHAIAIFDVVEHEDRPWLVMEYLASRDLAAVLAERTLDPSETARVGEQVAAALGAAHAAGIVHRDVKPGNVLLAEDGRVKVTDFGISRAVDEATLTSTGMVAGTPAYLAPEVARGSRADFRSDVWALGATLYAAVEGTPPFGRGDNALALLHRVASGEIDPPQRAGPLTPLLERVLQADPDRRPPIDAVHEELARLVADAGDTAAVPEPLTPALPQPAMAPTPVIPAPAAPPPAPAVSPAASPAAPPSPSSTRPAPTRARAVAGVAAAVLLVAVAVAAVLLGSSGGSTTASPPGGSAAAPDTTADGAGTTAAEPSSGSGGTTGSAAAAPATDSEAQVRAVGAYYGLLPDRLDEGWAQLTPSYQQSTAGGFASYRAFWGSLRQVTVRGVSSRTPGSVDATVTYTYRDGRVVDERTLFRMARQDGTWKIDGSTVLSSQGR